MRRHALGLLPIMVALALAGPHGAGLAQESGTRSIALPADPVGFQPGPGSQLVSALCLMCHSAEYVYMQPRHSPEAWAAIVEKMRSAFGCPIEDAQIQPVVDYLVSQNAETGGVSVASAARAPARTVEAGEPGAGRPIYERLCVTCHGAAGRGDGPIGRALSPPAADLTAASVQSASDDALLAIIRQGKPPTAMPAWGAHLSAAQMRDVLAYIRSLAR